MEEVLNKVEQYYKLQKEEKEIIDNIKSEYDKRRKLLINDPLVKTIIHNYNGISFPASKKKEINDLCDRLEKLNIEYTMKKEIVLKWDYDPNEVNEIHLVRFSFPRLIKH